MPKFIDPTPPGRCIFCRLISGEIPAARVYEDELTLAFMDLGQVNPGHVLVAVKRHAATLLDLTSDEAAAAMRTAQRLALALKQSFDPPGITLLQANGKEGEHLFFVEDSTAAPLIVDALTGSRSPGKPAPKPGSKP